MSMNNIYNFLESNEECQFTVKELQEVLTEDITCLTTNYFAKIETQI